MTRIVGVHGVGYLDERFAPAKIVAGMSRIWREAIASGVGCAKAELDITCAYYAPCLKPLRARQGGTLDGLPDEAKDMVMEWLVDLGAPDPVIQGWAGWPLRQGAQWAQQLTPWLTEKAIAVFFEEVHTFLQTPGGSQRVAARDEVAQTIRAHKPEIIVAHSLGTVVTYEALWACPELTADLLITMGSPLGMTPVRSRLEPGMALGEGRRPPGVRRWVNVADPGDPVAVPRGLSALFPGIERDYQDSIGALSIHSAKNYLQSPPVAKTIAPLLAGGSQSSGTSA